MDFQEAISFWDEKDKTSIKMDRELLAQEITDFLMSHRTCALATADLKGNVRCTPLEYFFKDNLIWILTEGGHKFIGLQENKNVSVSVFDAISGFGSNGGLQIDAVAQIIEPWSEEYLALLEHAHLPVEKLKSMPHTLHLLKIIPKTYDYYSGKLKKRGYGVRQHLQA